MVVVASPPVLISSSQGKYYYLKDFGAEVKLSSYNGYYKTNSSYIIYIVRYSLKFLSKQLVYVNIYLNFHYLYNI